MLWKLKLTLDIVNITGLKKDYAVLLEGVVNRLRAMVMKIGRISLDREFFNLASILALFEMGVDFVMQRRSTGE